MPAVSELVTCADLEGAVVRGAGNRRPSPASSVFFYLQKMKDFPGGKEQAMVKHQKQSEETKDKCSISSESGLA